MNNLPAIRKQGRTVFFHHPCHVCGKDASFGHEVDLKRAMAKKDKKWLGIWTCGPKACRNGNGFIDDPLPI